MCEPARNWEMSLLGAGMDAVHMKPSEDGSSKRISCLSGKYDSTAIGAEIFRANVLK